MRKIKNERGKFVSRGSDGWYSLTYTEWFTPNELANLGDVGRLLELVNQGGYKRESTGGLTAREILMILFYIDNFVKAWFQEGKFKKELLLKICEARKELCQIQEQTKKNKYCNKFTERDNA